MEYTHTHIICYAFWCVLVTVNVHIKIITIPYINVVVPFGCGFPTSCVIVRSLVLVCVCVRVGVCVPETKKHSVT